MIVRGGPVSGDLRFYLDGAVNGQNYWSKDDDKYAIWYDKNRNWCLGSKSKLGEICGEDQYLGKSSADPQTKINCPHDDRLTYYKGAARQSMKVTCIGR